MILGNGQKSITTADVVSPKNDDSLKMKRGAIENRRIECSADRHIAYPQER